jgi:hypothetical protein
LVTWLGFGWDTVGDHRNNPHCTELYIQLCYSVQWRPLKSSKMATHMLRKSCYNFLRFSTLRQHAARQISVLANRNVFSIDRINKQPHLVENSRLFRPPILQVKYFSDGPALTAAELEQRTLEVIKSFDKVDPDKVRKYVNFK